MFRALYTTFILLALLGDARIFLFILNRFVFGSHRAEKSPYGWLMFAVPPLLLALTLLFWPLSTWIDRLMSTRVLEALEPQRMEEIAWSIVLAKLGAGWLTVAASVGIYWIVDRVRVITHPDAPLAGTIELESEVVRLRRAHLPFPIVQKLGGHNDVYDIEVTRHEVFVDDLPQSCDGYRIAFLTDTHVASFVRRDFYREIVARTNAFEPDLVLFGGDFVTFGRHIALAAKVLTDGLRAREGMYAVRGNHDYWAGIEDLERELGARGVEFLTNRSVKLRGVLPLVGIDEIYRGTPDVARAFASVDAAQPCIGISHHPDIIDLVPDRRLDLLLCGHTHGGQIRLPFFGPVVVPSAHEAEYAAGFHRRRDVLLYVSRGIGAIPPLRILCRPEVALFTLRRGRRA
jgi:predicted MPP superfamily phosphohydrolase